MTSFLEKPKTRTQWMGHVIHCTESARKPEHHNILQVADVDTGGIRWVNADLLTHIVLQC